MIDCHVCPEYKSGAGSTKCLKCAKYKRFQIKNNPRPQIAVDILPQAILESIADTSRGIEIIDAIRKLPLTESTPLMMQYILGASTQEIADYHIISRQRVDKKNKLSIKKIKMLLNF